MIQKVKCQNACSNHADDCSSVHFTYKFGVISCYKKWVWCHDWQLWLTCDWLDWWAGPQYCSSTGWSLLYRLQTPNDVTALRWQQPSFYTVTGTDTGLSCLQRWWYSYHSLCLFPMYKWKKIKKCLLVLINHSHCAFFLSQTELQMYFNLYHAATTGTRKTVQKHSHLNHKIGHFSVVKVCLG